MRVFRFLAFLGLLVCLLAGGAVAFLVAATEREPALAAQPAAGPADAARARAVLRRLRRGLARTSGLINVAVTEDELNSLLAVGARGLASLRGRANVSPDAVRAVLSVRLPRLAWLNLRVAVRPSNHGLYLESVRLGRFDLPAAMILPALEFGLDYTLGNGLGGTVVHAINGVSVTGKTVALDIALTRAELKALRAGAKARWREVAALGDAADVRVYYRALDAAARDGRLPTQGSFVPYLRAAFALARRRSESGGAADENRSAVLALAIYCGHWAIESLVGDVRTEAMKRKPTRCRKVTLGDRVDLRQHFIVSAALEVASQTGLAFAIGEIKELLDANRGGSGFSFADLAADRAGIRFAALALGDKTDAKTLQMVLAKTADEAAIFPDVSELPEGLSEVEFKRRFGGVDSPAYRGVLAAIDQRIDLRAAYRPR